LLRETDYTLAGSGSFASVGQGFPAA